MTANCLFDCGFLKGVAMKRLDLFLLNMPGVPNETFRTPPASLS
jgi:hypothetical protein